jgi:hypothetical protein
MEQPTQAVAVEHLIQAAEQADQAVLVAVVMVVRTIKV